MNQKVVVLMLSWLRFDVLLDTLAQIPLSCKSPLGLCLRVQGNERLTDDDRRRVLEAASGFCSTDIYFTRDNVGTAAGRLDLIHRGSRLGLPYMMFTDDDIEFPQGGIDAQIETLSSDLSIGSVSLKPRGQPRAKVILSDGVRSIICDTSRLDPYNMYLVGSASLMFRTSLYTKYFIAPDSAYYIGTWDWDFIFQIRRIGLRTVMLPNYEIVNKRTGGCAEYRRKRLNKQYVVENRALFKQKWGIDPVNPKIGTSDVQSR